MRSVPGPDYSLCRLYHGRGPPPPGPPDQLPFLPRCVDVRWQLKKVVNFLGGEKCTPREKILGYAYEKRVPALRWYGGRIVNTVLISTKRWGRLQWDGVWKRLVLSLEWKIEVVMYSVSGGDDDGDGDNGLLWIRRDISDRDSLIIDRLAKFLMLSCRKSKC